MGGKVIISIDFELGWGHRRDRPNYVRKIEKYKQDIEQRIDQLVNLFDTHDIAATWAFVGKLLEAGDDPLFHNPPLIKKVINSDVPHEIGLHSYSHVPFNEFDRDEAREDILRGKKHLRKIDVNPDSFVFPQNKISHTELLSELGFQCYRTCKSGLFPSIIPPVVNSRLEESGIHSIPSSLFIADPNRPDQFLKYQAIIGLQRAMRNDGIIHFWFHPHNTIVHPEIFETLDQIFSKISRYKERGKLDILTMNSIIDSNSVQRMDSQ